MGTLLNPPNRSLLLALMVAMLLTVNPALAGGDDPARIRVVTIQVTQHEWWLIPWESNQTECQILAEHEGLPKHGEVLNFCGEELFEAWMDTPPCQEAARGGDTINCPGHYLYLASSQVVEKEIEESLPSPQIWISLKGCEPTELSYRCVGTPYLILTGEEPLDGERITAVYAEIDGESFSCEGERCEIPIRAYPEEGIEIEIWAESSFGDESEHHTAFIRALLLETALESDQDLWQVDVLSDRWQGEPLAACSYSWKAFPPVNDPPDWLTTPDRVEALSTDEPLELLAGRLLSWGLVDASECPWGGLLPDGSASPCGLEHSREAVNSWQDRFDQRILEVAEQKGVPARLMKSLFAEESQFWPGGFPNIHEYGLGGLHEGGGDALLLWNVSFYEGFCPLILSDETCRQRYHRLDESTQALLRGALAIQADVRCLSCPGGVDLSKAEISVDLFAEILLAGCDQVGQVVRSATLDSPGSMASYDDLWRYVLVNYNAGPGCLSESLDQVQRGSLSFTWPNVRSALADLEACDASVRYVDRITQAGGN